MKLDASDLNWGSQDVIKRNDVRVREVEDKHVVGVELVHALSALVEVQIFDQ